VNLEVVRENVTSHHQVTLNVVHCQAVHS
jgi:hypothetical protein